MPGPIKEKDQFTILRLMNPNGSAEGSNLPPRQIGQFRVPFVTNFRLIRTIAVGAQTQFTVAWDNPTSSTISHYSVYIILSTSPNAPPLGPYNTQASPAQITIPTTGRVKVTFLVQTVLNNGMVSDFQSSPTCAGETTEPAAVIGTNDATPKTIEIIRIPANTTVGIETIIVARRTGGSSGGGEDGARYKLSAVYKNIVGIATIIGAITKIADEDQVAWDATFTPTDDTVFITITGAANNDISWKSTTVTYSVSGVIAL